jgi:HSP20 family protein
MGTTNSRGGNHMANITRRPEGRELAPRTLIGGLEPYRLLREMLRWDPFAEMEPVLPGRAFTPAFEVKETKDSYVFKADMPGMKEDQIDISVTGNRLTMSGERSEEERKEDENYFAYERSYGSFSRSFTLPEGADLEHVQAEMKEGVLTIRVPKKPESQPRKISVQAEKPAAGTGAKAKA